MRTRTLLLPLLACLARCATDPTGVYLTLTVDAGISARINYAVVRVFDGSTTMSMAPPVSERAMLVESGRSYTFFIERTQGRARARIEVDGGLATPMVGAGRVTLPTGMGLVQPGMGVVSDRALVSYIDDQVLKLTLTLWPACVAARCTPSQHCIASGGCTDYEASNLTRHRW
jgi:hypothetical protein